MSTMIAVLSLDQRMKVMTFAMESGNLSMIDGIVNLQTMVDEHSIRLAAAAKQKCITNFFRK